MLLNRGLEIASPTWSTDCINGLYGQGMVWNGMENGMERKFRYGIWKKPEWNGMEDFKNGMKDNLPYFHTNSILDFVRCIYRKIHADIG